MMWVYVDGKYWPENIIILHLPVWSCILPITPSTKPKHTGFQANSKSVAEKKREVDI